MSATDNTNDNAPAGAGANGAGATASADTPAQKAAESSAATSAPGAGNNGAGRTERAPPKGASAALARAEARIAAHQADNASPPSHSTGSGQAQPSAKGEGDKPNSSEPSGQAPSDKAQGAQANGSGDGEAAKGGIPEQTDAGDTASPTAPRDWPDTHKERFNALDSDTAKSQVLDFYKGFQGAFTRANQELNEERARRKDLFVLDEQFVNDPKAVIQALAQRAQLPVFFEQASSDEIPTFENSKELLEHIHKETEKRVTETLKRDRDSASAQTRKTQASESLRAELKQAVTDHADFDTHREAVYHKLTDAKAAISVEDAYRLVTFEALARQAADGRKARAELKTLQAKLETQAKRATMPVRGAGHGQQVIDDQHKSKGARAFERAEQRRVAAR